MTAWTPERHPGPPRPVEVTLMQRNVLESVCEGKSNRLIMADWGIGENTVKAHIVALLKATGARDRLHLAAMVHRREVQVTAVRLRRPRDHRQAATLGDVAAYCPAS